VETLDLATIRVCEVLGGAARMDIGRSLATESQRLLTQERVYARFSIGTAADVGFGDSPDGLLETFDSVFRDAIVPSGNANELSSKGTSTRSEDVAETQGGSSDEQTPSDQVDDEYEPLTSTEPVNQEVVDGLAAEDLGQRQLEESSEPVVTEEVQDDSILEADDAVAVEEEDEDTDGLAVLAGQVGLDAVKQAIVEDNTDTAEPIESADLLGIVATAGEQASVGGAPESNAATRSIAGERNAEIETEGESKAVGEFTDVDDWDSSDSESGQAESEPATERGARRKRGGARYGEAEKHGVAGERVGDADLARQIAEKGQDAAGQQSELISELTELMSDSSGIMDMAGLDQGQPADVQALAAELGVSGVAATKPAVAAMESLARNVDAGAVEAESGPESRVGIESPNRNNDGRRDVASGSGRVESGTNEMRVRLVQRVSRAFQRLGPDGGRVNIMLHPAELGSVKLELRIKGQHVDARMVAESETAMSVLRENLPELKQRLVESGMIVDNIELEVAHRDPGTGTFDFGERGDSGQWRQDRGASSRKPAGNDAGKIDQIAVQGAPSHLMRRTRGSLDVRA
jgi:flagellar hook-length control protein FliK